MASFELYNKKKLQDDLSRTDTFDSRVSFNSAGGAAVLGDGIYNIGGSLFTVKDEKLISSSTNGKGIKRLKIAVIGNSIANQLKNTSGTGAGTGPKLVLGHVLNYIDSVLGVAFEPVECAATTRCDSNGIYGYSGGRLGGAVQSILDDLPTQFFDTLDNAGQIPDVVWCYAIIENDIGTDGIQFAELKLRVDRLVLTLRQKWPGVMIILSGCRPSVSYDTAAKKQAFADINAYIETLDNGIDIFSDIPDYLSSSTDTTQPASVAVIGSLTGTALTVESTTEQLKLGYTYLSYPITAFGTGTGGAGTYTIGGSPGNQPAGTALTVYKYTDTVHPTPRGRIINARNEANILKRIAARFVSKYRVESHNPLMTGSVAVPVIAGLSGTMPTGAYFTAQTAGVTTVSLALNPGWRITYSTIPDSAAIQVVPTLTMPLTTPLPKPVYAFKTYLKLKIVSGAEYIHAIAPQYRTAVNGGAAAAGVEWLKSASSDGGIEYINGDEFIFSSPIIRATAGDYFSQIFQYLNPIAVVPHVPAEATIVIEVIDAGFEVVDPNISYGTLVAGTVTILQPEGFSITSETKVRPFVKTPGGTPGALFVSAKTVGTSVVITSTNAADTSVIGVEFY